MLREIAYFSTAKSMEHGQPALGLDAL